METTKERVFGYEAIRGFITENLKSIIVLIFVIIVSLFIDFSQKGLMLEVLMPVYYTIRSFGWSIGITYTRALTLISGSFGVMLTVTNIILTLTTNMANRAENYVFGFSREEINFSKSKSKEYIKRSWVMFAPFFLMFTININFCVASYVIMLLSYCCVFSTFSMLFDSFDVQKDLSLIINRLKASISKIEQYDSKEYEEFLKKFLNGKDKADYSEKITKITKALIDEALKQNDMICFNSIYCYFSIVVMSQMGKNREISIKIAEDAIHYLDAKLVEKFNQDKIEIIFAAIVFSIGDLKDDNEVSEFLNVVINRLERSKWLIKQNGTRLSIDIYEKEMGILLIVMETWLLNNEKIKNNLLPEQLVIIWECGRKYLGCENEKKITLLVELWEDRMHTITLIPDNLGSIKETVERLRNVYLKKKGESIIFSVWKNSK